MFKCVSAYLYKEGTVVINKMDIKGAKEGDFKEVQLYLPHEFIKESAEELEYISDDEDY